MAEDVKELKKIWSGFQSARVLITANNLGVFDHLKKAQGPGSVAMAVGSDERATELLLDALAAIGLLKKQSGKYRNTPLSNRFLVKGAPEYQGDIIRHVDTLWQNWSALDEVVMTGRPAGRAFDHHAFILGMHNLAVLKVKEVLGAMKLKGVKKALDLGSGPGTYALEMAKKGVAVTLFDTVETIKIAKKFAARHKVKSIRFVEGDFFTDPIGVGYDLIFISQIFHAYSEEENAALLRKCYQAMNPGGRVLIQEFYLNHGKTYPPQSALFSINMLVNTEAGRCYTPSEMSGWLSETGFKNVTKEQLDDAVLVEGTKEP